MTNEFRSINSSLCQCQRNAVGHSMSSFPASRDATAAQDTAAVNDDCCEVCLVAEHDARIALVPCGHQRFGVVRSRSVPSGTWLSHLPCWN